MKLVHIRNLVLLVMVALLSTPVIVRAEEETTELAKQMEVIEDARKALRKSLKNPEANTESAATLAEMRKAAVACRELVPAMAANMPEAERAKFVEAYQKDMDLFIKAVDELGEAIKAGKNEEAQDLLKALGDHEDEGHEKYTE